MLLKQDAILQGGKYKIEKVLGQGGFGITYLAEQNVIIKGEIGEIKTKIKVTIKEFFMKELCNRDSDTSYVSVPSVGSKELVGKFKAKFVKEVQNIARLNHDHIIKVLDVFEENGTAYYVMEYIDGGSLNERISQYGVMSEKEAVHYISQIADALRYIHEQKINHLDVKPSNILLKEDAISVLIDFGLAKQYDKAGDQTSSTPVGVSKGYAPMEQYKAGGVSSFSPVSDIYSLGATLYKLVTGATPPEAHDVFDSGLPELPGELSSGVKQAITSAMQPSRNARPQSIPSFLEILGGSVDTEETILPQELIYPQISNPSTTLIIPKEPTVDQENAYALFCLGASYENGDGVTQSFSEAVKCYRKAAEQGYAAGQFALGCCYEFGQGITQSYKEAAKWYLIAAEQGYGDAQYNLGLCYYFGNGVDENHSEAVKWYRKAADQGDEDAINNLIDLKEY